MKSVEQFISELKAYKGVSNVLVNERLSNDKLCDFWYGGLVIGFNYGNYTITIEAIGDIECMAQIKGEEDEIWLRDKSNGGNVGTELIDHKITKDNEFIAYADEITINPNFESFKIKGKTTTKIFDRR